MSNKDSSNVSAIENQTGYVSRRTLTKVAACFFLSGFAALLYQTAWMRQFSVVFGTSELAVATVLAVYMGGLAFGAAAAGRYVRSIRNPVLVYGFLEAGIAATALSVPLLLLLATKVYIFFLGGQPTPPDASGFGQSIFYFTSAFIILLLPTGLMGATLPILIRHVVCSDEELGRRVSLLYSINTGGAVVGTITAAFVLIRPLGLLGTVCVGATINLLIFLIASRMARDDSNSEVKAAEISSSLLDRIRQNFSSNRPKDVDALGIFGGVIRQQRVWILPIMLVSGSIAFYLEVLWTRLINHILGGSVYAFATMLAAFLTGIAIGSAIAAKITGSRRQAAFSFGIVQLGIAATTALVYHFAYLIVPATQSLYSGSLFAFAALLPATLFIGATFPLAVRIFSRDQNDVGPAAAIIYSWNTIGAIFGAILAGFFLIPLLGFEGSIKLIVLASTTLALLSMTLLSRPRRRLIGGTALLLVGLSIFYQPERPDQVINAWYHQSKDQSQYKEHFFGVGRSSTVHLFEHGERMELRTNGLPEASIDARGVPPIQHNQRWLTGLPIAARPDAESILLIGLGGGVALEGIPSSINRIDVVELEPLVVEANKRITNLREHDPLRDTRLSIVINDARNALRLSDETYDVIVSQPSHPWTAGASHLFTLEFMQLAKRRLTKNGVFVQWMNASMVDEDLLKTLTATVADVFSNVRLYQPDPGVLLFLGSESPLDIERQLRATGRPLSDHPLHFSRLGLNSVEDFLVSLSMDDAGIREFSDRAPISTDNRNHMAVHSRSFGDGIDKRGLATILAPYDPLLDNESWVHSDEFAEVDFSYIGNRLIYKRFEDRANELANSVSDRATALLIHADGLRYQGKSSEADRFLLAAIKTDPEYVRARYSLVRSRLSQLALGTASDETVSIADQLTGPPAAVVDAWTHAANRDWEKLARLDPILAQSNPTDPWYVEATQLRIEWRTKLRSRELVARHVPDALRLADRVLIVQPELDLYVLRAACGYLLEDPFVVLESARKVAEYIDSRLDRAASGQYSMTTNRLTSMLSIVSQLQSGLDSPLLEGAGHRVDSVKIALEEVQDRLREMLRRA